MTHKITWSKNNIDPKFITKTKITTVRWDDKNQAIFLNKTKQEVEASFAIRLDIMAPIEFVINKGEFIGHETYLNEQGEVYMENPAAEINLLMKMAIG